MDSRLDCSSRLRKARKDVEAEEASEAEKNTISILGSIARLERGQARVSPLGMDKHFRGDAPKDAGLSSSVSRPGTGFPLQNEVTSTGFTDIVAHVSRYQQAPECSVPVEKEARTIDDVFADRAPTAISMDLLWQLQANYYREFASRLRYGGEEPQEGSCTGTPQKGSDQVIGVQNRSGQEGQAPGVRRHGVVRNEDDVSTSGKGDAQGSAREGPSRKSVRRAKKRKLGVGVLEPESLPAETDNQEKNQRTDPGAAVASLPIEHCRDAPFQLSLGSVHKQTEGPGPPPNKVVEVRRGVCKDTTSPTAEAVLDQGDLDGAEPEEGRRMQWSDGQPSRVLYVKNLDRGVVEGDLLALFSRFEKASGTPLSIRLMQKGRMKGQAFVTFPDVGTAQNALEATNGSELKGRPLAIEFGRGAS